VIRYDMFSWTAPETLAEYAACDIRWGHYRHTKVHFDAGDRSGTLFPASGGGEQVVPPLGPLHVIAAEQPAADSHAEQPAADSHAEQPHSDVGVVENRLRMAVLDADLAARGLRAVPAYGSGIDDPHGEDSRAVFGLTDEQARELGLHYGQVAVFAWTGAVWSLLACATERRTDRAWTWEADSR
jgi:hypothetical protein